LTNNSANVGVPGSDTIGPVADTYPVDAGAGHAQHPGDFADRPAFAEPAQRFSGAVDAGRRRTAM